MKRIERTSGTTTGTSCGTTGRPCALSAANTARAVGSIPVPIDNLSAPHAKRRIEVRRIDEQTLLFICSLERHEHRRGKLICSAGRHIKALLTRFRGARFARVGHAPSLRPDLVDNANVRTAITSAFIDSDWWNSVDTVSQHSNARQGFERRKKLVSLLRMSGHIALTISRVWRSFWPALDPCTPYRRPTTWIVANG